MMGEDKSKKRTKSRMSESRLSLWELDISMKRGGGNLEFKIQQRFFGPSLCMGVFGYFPLSSLPLFCPFI